MPFWQPKQQPDPQPNALIVGNADNPDILVQHYQPESALPGERVALHPASLLRREALLQQMPNLARTAASMTSRTYVVRFAPEVAARIAGGSATLMQSADGAIRTVAVGANGQIIGHGVIVASSALTPLAIATATWQVLAVVTAQHYLHSINQRLVALEQSISELHERLDDRDEATLRNNHKRLVSLHRSVGQYQLSEQDLVSFVREADLIDRECGMLMEAAMIAMGRLASRIRTMSLQGMFDPANEVAVAKRDIQRYTNHARMWARAALTRVAAVEVRCALPGDIGVAEQRLEELREELSHWYVHTTAFTALVQERVSDVDSAVRLKFWEDHYHYRTDLIKAAKRARKSCDSSYKLVGHALITVQEGMAQQQARLQEPLELLIDVDAQGKIMSTRQVVRTMLRARP